MYIETKCAITCRPTICNLFVFVCKVSNDKIYNIFVFKIVSGYLSMSTNVNRINLKRYNSKQHWKRTEKLFVINLTFMKVCAKQLV